MNIEQVIIGKAEKGDHHVMKKKGRGVVQSGFFLRRTIVYGIISYVIVISNGVVKSVTRQAKQLTSLGRYWFFSIKKTPKKDKNWRVFVFVALVRLYSCLVV